MKLPRLALFPILLLSLAAHASVFAKVQGIVHDPTHRPIAGARVTLKAIGSNFVLTSTTNSDGLFLIDGAPLGLYQLTAEYSGFAPSTQTITLTSGTNPVFHLMLAVASPTTTVAVTDSALTLAPDTVTPTTLITRADIDQTPGASRTTSMSMVTDYVPGAYMTHDMLHIRGGHQTTWLIDGIAIPNTKIASNVGPQIDPKDIDSLEVQRGSYASELGDRTYGIFNVLPRNGFERNREAEFLITGGNLGTAEAQLSFGDHSQKTAWYASAAGSRSNYGLATPVADIYHDATNSQSGFLSLTRNQTPKDQLRLDAQLRQDYFDIPYDPSTTDWQSQSGYYASSGLRDAQTERDGFLILNWVHTLNAKALFELAPFYHYNLSNYDSLSTDSPVATTWHQSSSYSGGQADLRVNARSNDLSFGGYGFYQSESDLYGLIVNDSSAPSYPNTTSSAAASLTELYFSDHLRLGKWLSLLGGMRYTNYHAWLNESALYPRIGATFELPRLHWVLRGFYGHFFQPAPVLTPSASVINYAGNLGGQNTFTALPSERDEEHQFGIEIPYRNWQLNIDNFKTRINNFLDHSNIGESNMYFPIAVEGALVRGWEMTLRSPRLAHIGQFHLTYSNQIAQQRGAIIGGFTCSLPGDPACNPGDNSYSQVDHDQRNTLNTGFTATLPHSSWLSTNVYYGSGFSNGLAGSGYGPYQGNYLPVHTTFDLSAGHSFSDHLHLTATILNATNHRVLLDNSVTIGGFHTNDPRMLQLSLKYRFKF